MLRRGVVGRMRLNSTGVSSTQCALRTLEFHPTLRGFDLGDFILVLCDNSVELEDRNGQGKAEI